MRSSLFLVPQKKQTKEAYHSLGYLGLNIKDINNFYGFVPFCSIPKHLSKKAQRN